MPARERRRSRRFFRVLLALFPFDFRKDFGPEMEATFEDQERDAEARGGRWARRAVWARTIAGALREAPREHLDMLRQDGGFAVRVLRRSPGFAVTAVLTLALGVGATTAVFSLVNAVLLRPLPYRGADRLVMIRNTEPKSGDPWSVSYADFLDFARESRSFEDLAAVRFEPFNVAVAGEAERVVGMRASAGFLPLLGVSPALGRGPLASDETPSGGGTVVLSHGYWVRRFGGARDVLGRSITMSGQGFTIVGVLPPDFRFPIPVEVLASLTLDPRVVERGNHAFEVLAHLRPDITIDEARREMAAIGRRLAEAHPAENRGWGVTVVGFQDAMVGPTRPPLLLLMSAVSLVLLIACANLGNLLLARASARGAEIGIRTALGASRPRIVRQLLTESLVVGLFAGALGLAIAAGLVRVAGASLPAVVTAVARIAVDLRVLVFALAVSVATGIAFGLAPALTASRVSVSQVVSAGQQGRGGGRSRLRGALVCSEVALALMLLVAAGLMLRSLGNLLSVDPGVRTDRVLVVSFGLPPARYAEPQRVRTFCRELLSSVRAMPGVEAAGLVNEVPMGGANTRRAFIVEGGAMRPDGRPDMANVGFRTADAGYFAAIGMPLRRGRLLDDRDESAPSPVVLVNETMARRWWPGRDPLGKRIALATAPDEFSEWMTIVGVVGDVRHLGPRQPPQAEIFVPTTGLPGRNALVVRTTVPPATVVPGIRRAVATLDAELPLGAVQGMDDLLAEATGPARVTSGLLTGSALLALALAMLGLHGVVSYAVTQRTHEIGLRVALGATGAAVLWLVVRHTLTLAAAGTAMGLAGAWALSRLLSRQLVGVSPTDPVAYAGAAAAVGLVALAASWIPARRATRIDPVTALRCE